MHELFHFLSLGVWMMHWFLTGYGFIFDFGILCGQGVLDGKYDDLSEQSFYMVGGIEEAIAKAEKIAKENA